MHYSYNILKKMWYLLYVGDCPFHPRPHIKVEFVMHSESKLSMVSAS